MRFGTWAGFVVLGLALACGGGGGGSSSTPPAVPTLTSFAPGHGVVGSPVTLTGTGFTGASQVAFNGQAAPFTVQSATGIQATVPAGLAPGAYPIRVTTPGGSATSTGAYTVDPTPAPTLSGFLPASGPTGTTVSLTGSGFWSATAVAFGAVPATFTILSDTQIQATVPAGASTNLLHVTNPTGSAASAAPFTVTAAATLDLTIDGLYLTQATQNYPAPAVPLVKDRSAWVRVFVKANEANSVQPQVRVRFLNGATTHTLTLTAPTGSVPTTITEGVAGSSWNAAVPAAWIQPGVHVIADVNPTGAIPEATKANNGSGDIALDVRTLPTWKITLVPVATPNTSGGKITGAVDTTNMAAYVDMAKRIWPMPDAVDVTVRSTFTSSLTAPLDNSGSNWDTVLSEISALRSSDASTRYYYGVVATTYSGGVAGLGYVPGHAAIGWDKGGSRAGVLAHEVGHNFSRPHSPCGGVTDADPGYPTTGNYVGGGIGVTGWDTYAASGNLKAATNPATYTDIMGYCGNQWVSDYCYKLVLAYRAGNAANLAPSAAEVPAEDCLILWGRVEDGRMILEPAFPAFTTPSLPEGSGDLSLDAQDAAGRILLSLPFTPTEVADLPEGRSAHHFAFAVPRRLLGGEDLHLLRLLDRGVERARHTRLAAGPGLEPALAAQPTEAGRAFLWDADRHPLLVVRDALGQVRGFLRGGRATLPAEPGLEILACDGVGSRVQRVSGDSQ
ncbi:MAG TPA: IPT/TIG domain-containing protein [Holophagaceae bacterium]|nr:IPT/TIG domain-containing protein [Holophagaceae bacterium]